MLYWHVDSKRRLLDLMAEELMHRAEQRQPLSPAPDQPWWDWLEKRTRAMYETLITHRDAPRVVAGSRPTVAALPAIEAHLATLVDAHFTPGEALECILTLDAYTTGCALEWQAEAARVAETREGALGMEIRTGAYPTIVKAFTEHRLTHETSTPHDQMFEHGLRLILAGLRAHVSSGHPPQST